MKLRSKILILLSAAFVVAGFAVCMPYETRGIPEWDIRVVDAGGNPVARGQVTQEWLNPIHRGRLYSDARETSANGDVVFPERILKNRLLHGFAPEKPEAHVFICWRGQFADVNWDGVSEEPAKVIRLKVGACPYS